MKKTASERTISMFTHNTEREPPPMPEAEVEEQKAERVAIQDDCDRNRENAFNVQEWTTSAFGQPDAKSTQYRMSKKDKFYYLEELRFEQGKHNAYGYTGVIIHERDLLAAAGVVVEAAKALKAEQAKAAKGK
jgi:hypothetical protein